MDKYKLKKQKNQAFLDCMEITSVSNKTLERIEDCGTFLNFLADKNIKTKKLHEANFCGNRFCPMCSWRLAMQDTLKLSILMQYLKEEHKQEFIFLTLTTPNVIGEQLDAEIKKFNKAFNNLTKRIEFINAVNGYVRKLEVTYSKEPIITKEMYKKRKEYYQNRNLKIGDTNPTYDTYNPHFHIILSVNKSYFTDTKIKISKVRWLELWKEVTKDNRITQVHVQKAKNDTSRQVYEVAKYSAKDSDYMINEKVFKTFYDALKGKQLIVFGGNFKDSNNLFNNKELDKYKQIDNTEYIYMVAYIWQKGDYKEFIKRELTEEEKNRFNKTYKDSNQLIQLE